MKRVLIIAGGEKPGIRLLLKEKKKADAIIAADAGLIALKQLKIMPDTIIGDLDSVREKDLGYFIKQGIEIIRLETEKNQTDSEAAVDLAIKRGAKEIVILGGTGKRLDHTLCNLMLLKRAHDSGVKAYLKDKKTIVHIVSGTAEINGRNKRTLSLLPAGEEATVKSIKGLYYPLDGLVLKNSHSRGISNIMVGNLAVIDVIQGSVYVIQNI